jgi:ABC-2 type transport system permease protein
MFKFFASVKKESLLLWNDKVGLLLMFAMPLLLVFVISVIQDSATKIAAENRISMLAVNRDKGVSGENLLSKLTESGMFEFTLAPELGREQLNQELLSRGVLMALYIPEDFSSKLSSGAEEISSLMLSDLGMSDGEPPSIPREKPKVAFYFDPVLQESFTVSIQNIVGAFVTNVETALVIDQLYTDTEIEARPDRLKERMLSNRVQIEMHAAGRGNSGLRPNSTQHNVPAWTIFAMFFMVVSLGSNVVKERSSGSFLRLKTMPTSFFLVILSKMLVYVVLAVLQVVIIFSVGIFLFEKIGLHRLTVPDNHGAFAMVVLLSSLAAVSYALVVGTFARSQEQANGFGAISIVLFAALGGIWVPIFVMPDFMQVISKFSPLQWCLQGFYILFLKEGSWGDLKWVILSISGFILSCLAGIYMKLRSEKLV